jgi:hypothetical protein
LLAAAQAHAGVFYGETSLTPLTATFDYGHDGPCYYECGSTDLFSWTVSGVVDTLDAGKNGYGPINMVDAEGDIAGTDFTYALRERAGSPIHMTLEEGIERGLLLSR